MAVCALGWPQLESRALGGWAVWVGPTTPTLRRVVARRAVAGRAVAGRAVGGRAVGGREVGGRAVAHHRPTTTGMTTIITTK